MLGTSWAPLVQSSDGKESACDVGDPGSIPLSGRSPGEGDGYPLQYSCLGIPWMKETDVHGVAESDMNEPLTLSLSHMYRYE